MLTLRTLRNLWFQDHDGVMTKCVDDEESLLDSVDLTDDLEPNQAIASAVFDDEAGVTLGTPSIAAGVVSFTHQGTGSAVLQVVLNFVAYLLSLFTETYAVADYWLKVSSVSAPGLFPGALTGDTVTFFIEDRATGAPFGAGLDGAIILATLPITGTQIRIRDLLWDPVAVIYSGVLMDDLPSADDKVYSNDDVLAVPAADVETYDLYLTKPTRTLRTTLRFVDPSDPNQDDYS